MKNKREKFCLMTGTGFSLFLHAGMLFLLFLQIEKAPEPGGSGLLMDAFLVSGGDGFYQKGVPWGDFDFKAGKKGEPVLDEKKREESTSSAPIPQEQPQKIEKKQAQSPSAAVIASPKKKKTTAVKKKTKTSAQKKVPAARSGRSGGQGGSGTQPYGGVIGDAAGFGAGHGTGIGIGTGRGVGDIKAARYFVRLRRLFQRRLKYPEEIENQKVSGRVIVRFHIQKDGKLKQDSVSLMTSSGNDILDKHALKTISEAVQLPAPPYGEMTIEIPIVFRVYH